MPEKIINLIHQNESISFIHRVNRKLKNCYIQIKENNVILKSPGFSDKQAKEIILKKITWIQKKTNKKQLEKPDLSNKFFYLGEEYQKNIISNEFIKQPEILFKNNVLEITISLNDLSNIIPLINHFYKLKAIELINRFVDNYSELMNLFPQKVKFRKAKSQWGSCSSKNNLSFNYFSMILPIECIEYLVVHELAHIKHKNHSKDFWHYVETYLPDYKIRDQKIKKFHHLLHYLN